AGGVVRHQRYGPDDREEPMIEPDVTMTRIGKGIGLSQRGDRDAARHLFEEVWNDIGGESGDPLHRCALAHAMPDVQDDLREELVWDLRALAAADLITDERLRSDDQESSGFAR
ncbi:MAG: hypothetical protein ACRDTF_23800, partial [Pseudonocardiaceae bacterium]